MKLEDLGYKDSYEKYRLEQDLTSLEVGRVIAEHKERYTVRTTEGDLEAEITGNM
jgi:ribosome biogenesis GTPase